MDGMDLSHLRALIFDLDGTLIDSQQDLINATNATLRELGRDELPSATVSSFIGHGAAKLVARALGPDATEREQANAVEIFLRHYEANKLDYTRAYPGVPEALEKLFPMPLAVLTNKPLLPSRQILESLSLAKYFGAIYGGDSFLTRKPDPLGARQILQEFAVLASDALFIGDSEVDVETARNAGMWAATVNYGFGVHDRGKFPADLYLDGLSDLVPLLRRKIL
jgi:phosphoglycolate phosphatase